MKNQSQLIRGIFAFFLSLLLRKLTAIVDLRQKKLLDNYFNNSQGKKQ